MRVSQTAIRDHDLIKYLQLVPQPPHANTPPFSFALPDSSTLRDALVAYVELLRFRLAVQGAFVLLLDGNTPHFLGGTPRPPSSEEGVCGADRPESADGACWLGTTDADLRAWLWTFQQTISIKTSIAPPKQPVFSILSLAEHDRLSNLSSVCHAPHLAFYAGTPITSTQGVPIGAVFVVDNSARNVFCREHGELLIDVAEKCMHQLEAARESTAQDRWKRMNQQLTRFVGSRSIRAQQLEEPPSLGRTDQQRRRKEQVEQVHALALRHGRNPSPTGHVAMPEDDFSVGAESKRLAHAETEVGQGIVMEENTHQARATTAEPDDDNKYSNEQGETTYRKIFRRAAECLREGLQVDGVIFTNGLLGYHGGVQPTTEIESELELEMDQRPERAQYPEASIGDDPSSPEDARLPPGAQIPEKGHSGEPEGATTRTYTSSEYQRGVSVEQPPEILGMSTRTPGKPLEMQAINETTSGLSKLTEAQLQLLMDSHPNGDAWYVHDTTGVCYLLRNDTLVEDDSFEETRRLISTFPRVRQIIMQPLTDPVTLTRLAACFVWSTRTFPVVTDATDLPSLRGFLYVLESEISRLDASAAVKQKEAFVSSVSHELRTPLHGILGSVQLLRDTDLDPFQKDLTETINSSGSTLNETLASVLSYAKINQFERQQHKYRQRPPSNTDWSLPDKVRLASGPDVDFKGLYVRTNIATLCEEIAGVLEAGQSFHRSKGLYNIIVIIDIDYQENWNYFTEPGALRRIMMNIIGNALKYTAEGSVTITLTASEMQAGPIGGDHNDSSRRMITLAVKDTGRGISKDFMDNHLFVPFTQEDTTSSQGVGLGMSIVKSLVSLLAGEIKVNSEADKGTEVTVMMPMRLYTSKRSGMEKSTLDLEQRIAFLRKENLSVVLFGFSSFVRRPLEKNLRQWFHCNILESTNDAKPDVVVVNEGNTGVAHEVERTAHRYGQCGVLLSIVVEASTLAKPMRPIKGYRTWERVAHPIGPKNLGNAISACVVKLRELRVNGVSNEQVEIQHEPDIHGETDQQSRDDDRTPSPSRKGSPKYRFTSDTSPPIRSRSSATGSRSEDSNNDQSNLHVLVVEDNAVNRKLLGAFLKKYGCHHVQYAENGALAVKMVQGRLEGFDIIFMDISMPVMDGFTATRTIRRMEHEQRSAQSPSNPTSPAYIVALTGLASDRDEDEALAAGVDMYITKPVHFEKLSSLLKQREGEVALRAAADSRFRQLEKE